MKLKSTVLAICGLMVGFAANAQQDPQFTQNMFNKLYPNPGVAGSNNAICGTLLGRQQWVGFNGKPTTYLFSAHMPLSMITQLPIGAGLSVYSDRLGQFNYTGFKLAGSYRLAVGPGNLGIGISLGMLSLNLEDGWIALDDFTLDPTIPDAGAGKATFDADLGVHYEIQDKLYVGLSVLHLPASTLEEENIANADLFTYKVARHYYIMAGYKYQLPSMPLSLEPSTFIKTDGSSTQMDFNLIATYNDMFWAGLSYRLQDAIAPMLGVKYPINKKGTIKVGYSYDITTSTLSNYSNGSHEVMIGYCYDLSDDNSGGQYKSVRFLGN